VPRNWLAWLLLGISAVGNAAAGDPLDEALRHRIETLRTTGDARIGAGSASARALIASLYEKRGFVPLWTDPPRVNALLAAIEASTTHGLEPRDYTRSCSRQHPPRVQASPTATGHWPSASCC